MYNILFNKSIKYKISKMNNGKQLNLTTLNKSNYYPYKSERKSSSSQIIAPDKYMNNYILSQYDNFMNSINYINNHNKIYPYQNNNINYNTSNNNINNSLQNLYYERNKINNNQYLYTEDNNIRNNNYQNYINKGLNRKLIKEAKENLKNANIYNNMIKKEKNNYVRLNIVHCETQYPIMTCFNSDPYNRQKRKSFIHNYNNINNYIINSNSKSNNEISEINNEERMNSLQNESLFNIRWKNKNKYREFNNSYYDFRKEKNIKNIDTIKKNFQKFQNTKTNINEKILNTDYKNREKISKFNKYLNLNNNENIKANKHTNDNNEKEILEEKIKKFIGLIEKYFISSFYNLFHSFLSQMVVFIKNKIYENKNLLLKRFERIRNKSAIRSKVGHYTSEKIQELDNYYKINKKVYMPKKRYKYIGPIKNNIENMNIIISNNNIKENKITNGNNDNKMKGKETFQKIIVHKNNNSVDKMSKKYFNFYNKNKSQDNLLYAKKLSPGPIDDKHVKQYILRTNLNNTSTKKKLIYTKKKTNKFKLKKKFIIDENKNNKDDAFSFINSYVVGSPKNKIYKLNERYKYEYMDNDENEEIIEQIIIKDICTYDKKFSVFIKYVTSQQYEENYLRLKLKKLQNLYLNQTLEYIDITHTDSIFLPSININSNIIMNEISEEKETINFSNFQEDEKNINKLFFILQYIYNKKINSLFNLFFISLKDIIKNSNNIDYKRKNNIHKKMFKSKTLFNWQNKVLSEKCIDANYNKIKRSNSAKVLKKYNQNN